jgi:hypothetical protein
VYPLVSRPLSPPTVTTTSPVPGVRAAVRAVNCDEPWTTTEDAWTPAIVTDAPAAKLSPVIVTAVLPSVVPAAGVIWVTTGGVGVGVGGVPGPPLDPPQLWKTAPLPRSTASAVADRMLEESRKR